jgi:hypothetical protein
LALAGGDPKRAESLRMQHYRAIQRKSIAVRQAKKAARDAAAKAAREAEQLDGGDTDAA